jgi:hypothetical protein
LSKIKFISNQEWTKKTSYSVPTPTIKELPDWYKDADRFARMPNGEHYVEPGQGKIPTWKACPAMYDAFGSGYVLKTPTDIDFFINDSGVIDCKVKDKRYENFISQRPPMPDFKSPMGCYDHHFAWYPDWAVVVPKGYSVFYSTPINRFDLPFINTSGIIDNDAVNLPGTMPFFVFKDWEGTLPAGTPYMQLLPFKREDWKSSIEERSMSEIYMANMQNSMKYRKPNGGIYQRDVWTRRKYE